jgi:hypothetical protein
MNLPAAIGTVLGMDEVAAPPLGRCREHLHLVQRQIPAVVDEQTVKAEATVRRRCRQPQRKVVPEPRRDDARYTGVGFYRKYTEALLRKYLRTSLAVGRTPSILGREIFGGRVTSYRMRNFEDGVIFVHDMERCLERIDQASLKLIVRIALQEYTLEEAAEQMQISARHVARLYPQALDRLTTVLLGRGMLKVREEAMSSGGC